MRWHTARLPGALVDTLLVLQAQYNLGFTEEGCRQMSDEDNIFGPWKI